MHVSGIDASDCGKHKKISETFVGPTRRPLKWQFPSQVETGEEGRTRSILVCRFNETYLMRTKIGTVKELDPVNNLSWRFSKFDLTQRGQKAGGGGRASSKLPFWLVISI